MAKFDMETIEKITALTERCLAAEAERDVLAAHARLCSEEVELHDN